MTQGSVAALRHPGLHSGTPPAFNTKTRGISHHPGFRRCATLRHASGVQYQDKGDISSPRFPSLRYTPARLRRSIPRQGGYLITQVSVAALHSGTPPAFNTKTRGISHHPGFRRCAPSPWATLRHASGVNTFPYIYSLRIWLHSRIAGTGFSAPLARLCGRGVGGEGLTPHPANVSRASSQSPRRCSAPPASRCSGAGCRTRSPGTG
jgi:hypothetical protein